MILVVVRMQSLLHTITMQTHHQMSVTLDTDTHQEVLELMMMVETNTLVVVTTQLEIMRLKMQQLVSM